MIPDAARCIRCFVATQQLLHRDPAIAASRQSNQQPTLTFVSQGVMLAGRGF